MSDNAPIKVLKTTHFKFSDYEWCVAHTENWHRLKKFSNDELLEIPIIQKYALRGYRLGAKNLYSNSVQIMLTKKVLWSFREEVLADITFMDSRLLMYPEQESVVKYSDE